MNDSSKIKWLAVLVIVLVVLNISMMGYLWYAPRGGTDNNSGPRDGRGPAGLVIKELKFDDKQQAAFEKLRDEHHAAMVEIDKASRELHTQLFKTLANGSDSSAQKGRSDSLLSEISIKQKYREQVTYAHLMEVRKLCNTEQKKIFDDMIAKASLRRPMGPPPGRRGEGPLPPPGDRP